MTGNVCSQGFCDSAHIRYFFEVAVHPLIGRDRQDNTAFYAFRMIPVFLYYHPGYFQQRNITHIVRLLPRLTYPVFTVYAAYDMLRCQMLNIGKSQTRKAAEDEYIPHRLQAGNGKLLIHQHLYFFFQKECPVGRGLP